MCCKERLGKISFEGYWRLTQLRTSSDRDRGDSTDLRFRPSSERQRCSGRAVLGCQSNEPDR